MKHLYLTPAALAIAVLLGACASAPTSTTLLESARNDYAQAQRSVKRLVGLDVRTVVFSHYAALESGAMEILAKLAEKFPRELSRTVLGWSVKVDEAQSHGRTVFEWAPRSSGARALAAIADEIAARAP